MTERGLSIDFERSGGFTGIPVTAHVTTSQLSREAAQELENLVDRADLRRFASSAPGPGRPDRFVFRLRVARDGEEHEIWLNDAELDGTTKPLIERLLELGRRS